MALRNRQRRSRINAFDWISIILLIIGGINWGIIGLTGLLGTSQFNLVESILGMFPIIINVIYTLVGISGVYWLFRSFTM